MSKNTRWGKRWQRRRRGWRWLKPGESQWGNLRALTDRDIAKAFGIPLWVLQMPDADAEQLRHRMARPVIISEHVYP